MLFKRIFLMAIIPQLLSMLSFAQKIPYGKNETAGKYYNVNGIKLYVEEYGSGAPLLMIHGNGGDMSAFSENVPYFSKKYRVILVDSRSQGKSVDPNPNITFEQMADDFATLLNIMHVPEAYVLGWSDGGINAILMAIRHPDKVMKFASTGANISPMHPALPTLKAGRPLKNIMNRIKTVSGAHRPKKTPGKCLCSTGNSQT